MRTPEGLRRLLIAMLLWLFATAAIAAAPTPRIGVMTMQPGEIFFERFGHNAIVVDDPAAPRPVSYNFGFFDLDEPGFIGRFVQGDMRYRLVALPVQDDLAYYREVGRGVSIQWLDLSPGEAHAIADALALNARPENARYRYDYFTDNCSTRVRDALDRALGGGLRKQWNRAPPGTPSAAKPCAWPRRQRGCGSASMSGSGPTRIVRCRAGRTRSSRCAWPRACAKSATAKAARSCSAKRWSCRIACRPNRRTRRALWWPWLIAGLALAFGVRWLQSHRPRTFGALALPAWTLLGLLGALMAFLWCCTAHVAGWANHNLLLFSPLCLLLVPGAIALLRGRAPSRFHAGVRAVVAAGAILALFLQLPAGAQVQAAWLALLVPLHAAFALSRHSRRMRTL
jgi:hypothetical protein